MITVGIGVILLGYVLVLAVLFGIAPSIVASYVWGALIRESWWQRVLLQIGTFFIGWGVFGVIAIVILLGNLTGGRGGSLEAFHTPFNELVSIALKSVYVAPGFIVVGELVLFLFARARKKDTTATVD